MHDRVPIRPPVPPKPAKPPKPRVRPYSWSALRAALDDVYDKYHGMEDIYGPDDDWPYQI